MNIPQTIRSLLAFAEDGDAQKIQSILDQGISVDAADSDGNSLLHIASANGHEMVVRLLLVRGAALNKKNLYGWSPLMQAARHGHEHIVMHLLNNKADVSITNTVGVSALTAAIRGGHSKIVELLLENDFTVDCTENSQHFTAPLMVAAQDGRDDILRTLLRRGIPANQKHDTTGWTALMITAMTGQLPMARLLVDKGADPNKRNRHQKTALAIATEFELREIRGYLDRKTTDKPEKVDDEGDNIIMAVKKGDYNKVKEILLKHKDECNATTSDGATPLMYAAITGRTDMIELLIESGADVNAKDYENGWTALMQATYYGKVDAAKCLIALSADVGCRAKNNITAFDMALLINAPTSLFRLLAEHAMKNGDAACTQRPDITGLDSVSCNLTNMTMAWQNTIPSIPSDKVKDNSSTVTQKKSVWANIKKTSKFSKFTRTLKSAFKNPNKVDNFENTLIVSESETSYDKGSQHQHGFTTADPYSMTNHSAPKSRLPEERLAAIMPPFQSATSKQSQSSSVQEKSSEFRTYMSASLNSSGESSTSLSVVKPVKFLHNSGNSGGTNNSSPHSSGGASEVIHSFTLTRVKDFNNHSGDRHSDTILSKMAQMRQRKQTSFRATRGRMRSSASVDQLTSMQGIKTAHQRMGSRSESVLSSHSTSSTLTPPQSPEMPKSYTGYKSGTHLECNSDIQASQRHVWCSGNDELSVILQRLSLENYRPIFEEEEIDMDTFLTMTNGDLNELGIIHENARQRILEAINELSQRKENDLNRSKYGAFSFDVH